MSDLVLGAIVIGPIAAMSTLSAIGSLLLARKAGIDLLDAGADVPSLDRSIGRG